MNHKQAVAYMVVDFDNLVNLSLQDDETIAKKIKLSTMLLNLDDPDEDDSRAAYGPLMRVLGIAKQLDEEAE
ncbi:hypothetical protein [Weissella paramesenteroides]|uniref:Uncharacterized protein n=1 Tax=Weissella paramesenteroides ATCC 33313 TaxID=585506 RepID=C5R811_WEIPA|nr:hypothetical protein [Weissella paramesenteroides]EER75595.1 hypothetical protein HMPREF0877_0106 [Weissella paramesenteroides ATCC 33313]